MELLRQVLSVQRGRPAALATVIRVSGSAPRHPGAKMLVFDSGDTVGTIGGGRVEQQVANAAKAVANGAPSRRCRYHLVRDLAMCCGGTMDVYVEPLAPSLEVIGEALEHWRQRRPVTLVTPLDGQPKRLELACRNNLRSPRCEQGEFLEPVLPPDRVVLFGAGHICRAVVPLLVQVGFEVVVCDDGETEAEPPALAHGLVDSFDVRDVEAALGPLGVGDYGVIVTRDHAIDQAILERLLPRTEITYLGLIGSLGKIGRFKKRLVAKGIATPERWRRLSAPIGIDIEAETPAEIAISIVAELVRVRNRARVERSREEPDDDR